MSAESRLRRGDDPAGVKSVFNLTDGQLKELQDEIKANPKPKEGQESAVTGQAPGTTIAARDERMDALEQRVAQMGAKIVSLTEQVAALTPAKKK